VLEKYSNIGSLKRLTFDNLLRREERLCDCLEKFHSAFNAQKYRGEPQVCCSIGPSGCGKTHLAAAIANEA
jgi:DNA replication protein DnaC